MTASGPLTPHAPTTVGATPLITLDHVRFAYPDGGVVAVDDLSLTIEAGESIALIGPNGAGKTTVAKLLDGLLRPTAGTVTVAGRDTRTVPVRQLAADVGYVFQHPGHQLFARTVAEELAFGPRNLGLATDEVAARVAETAESFGLTDVLPTHPYRLTLSLRKLVAIASVCTMRPRVLVLDEPTTGQDHRTAERIAAQIERLVAGGDTVISLTHDLRLVAETSSRVLILDAGRLVADGPTREVLPDETTLARSGLRPPAVSVLSRQLPGRAGRPVALTAAELIGELRDGIPIPGGPA